MQFTEVEPTVNVSFLIPESQFQVVEALRTPRVGRSRVIRAILDLGFAELERQKNREAMNT